MEICRNQQWGSVCDNSWTNVDATVVCRHLGYSGFSMTIQSCWLLRINDYCSVADAQAFSNAFYGRGSGPLYLDNVQCSGSEVDLFNCPGDTSPSCTHADDAGVRCNPTRTGWFILLNT